LGYQVKHDLLISGSQIDLYAEKGDFLFKHRLIVECKDHKNDIGVDELRNFSSIINTLTKPAKPFFGLFVASKGFTKTAKQFSKTSGINVLTFEELIGLSFNLDSIISGTIAQFECDELGKCYVDLSCQVTESGSGTIYKPVEKFLDGFFPVTKKPGVAILGNFGTGKTSLCKHYAYLLAKRINEGNSEFLLPIYINLRDLKNLFNIENDVYNILNTNYKAGITESGLIQWFFTGRTLLFLDGFDEMASKLDRVSINESLMSLSQFVSKYNVLIVLTCRTHFFKTQVEEKTLINFLKLYMCDWGKIELIDYINKSLPDNIEESLKKIESTYNLEELAKTPIFLNMISATISELGGSINQSKLYEFYTDKWIDNQDYRSSLLPEDKRLFMQELAFEMFSTGNPKIHYHDLPAKIKELFNIQDYQSINAVDKDIRTCSFLVRDHEGGYHYVHKSYMEFFVGYKIAKSVKEHSYEDLEKCALSFEVAGFFANYFDNDWSILIRLLLGNDSQICRSNCALALSCLNYNAQIQDALILSFKTDKSVNVKKYIIDGLEKFKKPEGKELILKASKDDSDLGNHCLNALASFLSEEDVAEYFQEILNVSRNEVKAKIVLDSISRKGVINFRTPILNFIHQNWWHGNNDIVRSLIDVLLIVADLDFAINIDSFFTKYPFSVEVKAIARQAEDELSIRFQSNVRESAEENKRRGLSYKKNEGKIRGFFKYLVKDDFLKSVLKSLYR
jgi:hypothetical protein